MRVFAPIILNAQSIYAVLGQVFDEAGAPRSNFFEFYFTETKEIAPAGLVMMETLLMRLALSGIESQVKKDGSSASGVDLLRRLQNNSASGNMLNDESFALSNEMLPLHRFEVLKGNLWLQKIINNWLANQLYASSLVLAPQTHCLYGLIENVTKHAGVETMCCIASYDSDVQEVSIMLSDAGPGIPATVRASWDGIISDEVAIAKAIEGGRCVDPLINDCNKMEGGLGRLIREIIDRQRGRVIIISGFGKLSCFPSPVGKVHLFEAANAYYPGTMIEVTFSTDAVRTISTLNEPMSEARFSIK